MDYKIRISDGRETIEVTNPGNRMREEFAKRLIKALQDEQTAFLAEAEVELRRFDGGEPVTLKSRPIEVTISE
jgi:hypothetical protein